MIQSDPLQSSILPAATGAARTEIESFAPKTEAVESFKTTPGRGAFRVLERSVHRAKNSTRAGSILVHDVPSIQAPSRHNAANTLQSNDGGLQYPCRT